MSGIVGHYQTAPSAEVVEEVYSHNRAQKAALSSGKYQDAALRGRCFLGTTAVAGVAPGETVGTTGAFTLYNPAGSRVHLSVLRATMGYVSGTLGAGLVVWVANTNPAAAAITGTAITVVNCLEGGGFAATGKPLTTATLPATPTVMRPFAALGALTAAIASTPWQMAEDVDGGIVVSPGCAVSLLGVAAAGTDPLVVFGILWEEIPVSLA